MLLAEKIPQETAATYATSSPPPEQIRTADIRAYTAERRRRAWRSTRARPTRRCRRRSTPRRIDVQAPSGRSFQSLRRRTRQALADEGVAAALDETMHAFLEH